MTNRDTEDERPLDHGGQQGVNFEKMTEADNRDTPPAPVPGSKDDQSPKSRRERLSGPLSGEEDRSGTHTDQ